jgi:anti-sigma regulatory factor (Ser/Thr protein kinase)
MAGRPNVRLDLSNRPENVSLVREMLTGVAEGVDLAGDDLHDIRTAVTEACNNVSLHAYEGDEGPMEVEVYAAPDAIEVVVRDCGTGIRPRIRTPEDRALGIGLHVIQALAQRVQFSDATGDGTEVRMEFAATGIHAPAPPGENGVEPPTLAPGGQGSSMRASIAPTELARTVLPRLLSTLAARASFSTDRISDTQLVADALAAHVPRSLAPSRLSLTVGVAPRTLELRVGPLDAGAARKLLDASAVDGLGAVIEKLADDHSVAPAGSAEMLALRLSDR